MAREATPEIRGLEAWVRITSRYRKIRVRGIVWHARTPSCPPELKAAGSNPDGRTNLLSRTVTSIVLNFHAVSYWHSSV
jgi:hypothetical protein